MSYDAKQMAAVLTTCRTCGKAFYMTVPQAKCIRCRSYQSDAPALTEDANIEREN